VAEVSIYVHPHYGGQGIGKKLIKHLITENEQEEFMQLTEA
jgi:L-amino acid N-acyltransferase YncA